MEIDDLCKMELLDNETILEVLEKRYKMGQIYTGAGSLLLSINPYEPIELYRDEVKEVYKAGNADFRPHIYDLVNECVRNMDLYGKHSIVITGESGSGKTETAKEILRYLDLDVSRDVDTILEAFGNAETVMNENSSRFGKLISVGERVNIRTFLLEKSRVTSAGTEKNFHVFYYLLSMRGQELRNDYISYSPGADRYAGEMQRVNAALCRVGVDPAQVERILLGILGLGSLSIRGNEIEKGPAYSAVLENLELSDEVFSAHLLAKKIRVRGECIEKPYTDEESRTIRDSVARLLYQGLFGYIVAKINDAAQPRSDQSVQIAILDIFGFESLSENSMECSMENLGAANGLDQLCINWANERLFSHFARHELEDQQRILDEEGLCSGGVSGLPTGLEILESRCGVLDLVEEESFLNGSPANLFLKIQSFHNLRTGRENRQVFVPHYAGDVGYSLDDFLLKNRERSSLQGLCPASSFVAESLVAFSESSTTVIASFRRSLEALFSELSATRIKYVKCISPNAEKRARSFDRSLVLSQLRSNGVLRAVELSKQLYPHVFFFDDFQECFGDVPAALGVIKGRTRVFLNNRVFAMIRMGRRNAELVREEGMKMLVRRYLEAKYLEEQSKLLLEENKVLSEENKGLSEENRVLSEENIVLSVNDESNLLLEDERNLLLENDEIMDEPGIEPASFAKPPPDSNTALLESELEKKGQIIEDLKKELENLRAFCPNCRILEKKYKIQCRELEKMRYLELELAKHKKRLEEVEGMGDEDEIPPMSIHSTIGCLLQLFLENVPAFSTTESFRKDEILALAHSLHQALTTLGVESYGKNLEIFLDEIFGRFSSFEDDAGTVVYVLSNLVELSCISPGSARQIVWSHVSTLFLHLCGLQTALLAQIAPAAILDHQQLREFRVKVSIYRKIFAGPSIAKLTAQLVHFHELCSFYHLPGTFITNITSFLISHIDYCSFNALMARKHFLSHNRCIQINYNLSEIEKFCCGIHFHYGFFNLAYMREVFRVSLFINKGDPVEETFLNGSQVATLYELFDLKNDRYKRTGEHVFINKPFPLLPEVSELCSDSRFVHPRYLPEKSLRYLFKCFRSFSI